LALAWPADQIIYYAMHETPTVPTSPVTFVISMKLHAQDADRNWIGWKIERVAFRDPGPTPSADRRWVKVSPTVPTSDGLWWVYHANSEQPIRAEFVLPPRLVGTATAADVAYADLNYDFAGVPYPPPPGGAPYNPTAALDYTMTLVGELLAIEEGEDEPIDVPINDPPPIG
jgi:hypothetical protein